MSPTVMDRLLAKVDASGDCWLWTASVNRYGYGRIHVEKVNGQSVAKLAHRVLYELLVGPVPVGLDMDHLCRVRHCVNPDHLQPVTRRENARRGVGNPAAWLRNIPCKRGHPRTPENTYTNPTSGFRRCRPCITLYWQEKAA